MNNSLYILQLIIFKMATLAGGILDHPCDNDDVKMETIYQTDYIKRG